MRILMTNHRLTWYSGSDTYLYTLGKELIKRGHQIFIYSPTVSPVFQARRFKEIGIKVITKLKKDFSVIENNTDFDIIHGQHRNVLSDAHSIFPDVPVIFVSHGILPPLEKYPKDVLISRHIAVSEEILKFQYKNIPIENKEIIRNPINTDRFFYAPKKLKKKLQILISSNYFQNSWGGEEVWEAAKILNANVEVIGTNGKITFAPEKIIKNCDIGIGIGRSALEIMSMGKPVIVGDYAGYDGVITFKNYKKIKQKNFSSRTNKEQWNGKKLAQKIRNIFSSNYLKIGKDNRELILKYHNIKNIADRFEKIYREISKKV